VAFDLSPRRRDKALEMGATAAVDAAPFAGAFEALAAVLAGEAPADRSALEAVRANQCEVVFECSGSARAMEVSFLLAGKELTVFGYVPEPVRTMPAAWFAKELVIRNSKILQISDLQAVADLLAAGRIDTRPIVTDVMGFADYAAAVDKVRAGDAIKIALIWS